MKKQGMNATLRIRSLVVSICLLTVSCSSQHPVSIPLASLPEIQEPAPQTYSASVQETLTQLQGLPIEQFLEESDRRIVIRDPDTVIFMEGTYAKLKEGPFGGYGITNDRFTNISDAYIRETQELHHGILDLLRSYDRSAMSYDLQVAYDIYEWYLVDLIAAHQFMYYNYPVSSAQSWNMSQDSNVVFLMTGMKIKSLQDAQDYITRLSAIDTWVDQVIEGMQLRQQAGILPTKFMLRGTLAQLDRGYSDEPQDLLEMPEKNALYTSFLERLDKTGVISDEDKQALSGQVLEEITRTVIPAWQRLRSYIGELYDLAPEKTGALDLPNGEAFFAYALRNGTNTAMTPEQIYQLGVAEVARLQDEMRTQAHNELGYPRDLTMYELRNRLLEHAGPPERMKLLSIIQALQDNFDAKSGDYFNIYPQHEVRIKLAYPGITYIDPDLNSTEPYIIRYDQTSPLPAFELPSWWYHEIIPGHQLSQLLFYELPLPAPTFHKTSLNAPYLEGWALYMEQLVWEMGLYDDDPYGNWAH